MRIKSKPTFDAKYAAACKRMEAEKQMEIRESKKLYDLRRQLGSKKHEGRVGAKSLFVFTSRLLPLRLCRPIR